MMSLPAVARSVGPALVLGLVMLAGCSVQQVTIGQWYAIPTPPSGSCPALLWQFVAQADRQVVGTLGHVGGAPFARLSGMLDPDDSFTLTATDPGTGRTARISGQFTAAVSTIAIHGDGAGPGCDGKTFALRLGRYFARQGGGGGGGG